MAMVINTNMGAMNAQRILESTGREQTTAMERLTSGKAINRAADNAAGLAVTTGMTSQIMGTDQSIRNANDGISLIQTLDGSTEEVVSMLQRMREISVQSLNGTYSAQNRNQMDEEYQQLTSEIDRVAKTTQFNQSSLMLNIDATNGSVASTHAAATDLHVGWQTGGDNKINISTANFQISTNTNYGAGAFGTKNAGAAAVTLASAGTLLYGVAETSGADVRYETLGQTSVATVSAASEAVGVIDGAISNISNFRAKWGALQNRLDSTVSNLSNVNENMTGARSRIEDADFAKESANLARTQVLQQAGMSMLSQANQSSQNVLSLLR